MTSRHVAVLAIGLLVLGACSPNDDAEPPTILDPVIGAAPVGANAALYGALTGGPDRLLAVRSPASDRVTVMAAGTDMTMEAGDTGFPLEVGGEDMVFVPGADHLMLEQVSRNLTAGRRLTVEFVFEDAGTVVVDVPIVEPADLIERVPR